MSALKTLLVHQITRMIVSTWITDWCAKLNVQSAKDLSVRNKQQFYVNLAKTLVTKVIMSRLWVFALIIHWSCFETHFDWMTFFVTRCCWYFATFWHLVIPLLANNIKIADISTNFSSIFAISTYLQIFFITFQILRLEIEQQRISLVNFGKTLTKLQTSSLSYIHCWNFFISTAHVTFCLFTFWEEKKCNSGFNPWLSVLTKFAYFKEISRSYRIYDKLIKNLMTSYGICFHHSNPIILKIVLQSFMPLAVLKQKLR